jgi:peroxiredoxin
MLILPLALAAVPVLADLEIGKVPPDFKLPSKSGKEVKLSDLKGQVVLINFWASFCEPCAEELPALEKLDTQYRPAGLMLAAVNIDPVRAGANGAIEKWKIKSDVLYDTNRWTARDYDIRQLPYTVIVDREGVVRHVHPGYERGAEKKYLEEIQALLKK